MKFSIIVFAFTKQQSHLLSGGSQESERSKCFAPEDYDIFLHLLVLFYVAAGNSDAVKSIIVVFSGVLTGIKAGVYIGF